jgi:murein L,D-transpeptidase YafK
MKSVRIAWVLCAATFIMVAQHWAATGLAADLPDGFIADEVVIYKADRTLVLMKDGQVAKIYPISLGRSPQGAKTRQGDGKTPEGCFTIDYRNPQSRYHLSLHISYPDSLARAQADSLGCSPGGDIMIHGLPNGLGAIGRLHLMRDWTNGCIAVTNAEIEEIWDACPDGTPVRIEP